MYPAETREMKYQIIKKGMYLYVLSTYWYIPFDDPEVCTRYIFFHWLCTWKPTFFIGTYQYILEEKSMYRVHTSWKKYVPGTNRFMTTLCPFISVSYYSMVHTGMYRYVPGMYHWSRFQMIIAASVNLNILVRDSMLARIQTRMKHLESWPVVHTRYIPVHTGMDHAIVWYRYKRT